MANETQPRLAVILHCDVVGSTALVRKNERLAHERIQAAFSDIGAAIERYGGTVNEIRGDALVAEFPRASDAVLAALSGQEGNRKRITALNDAIAPVVRMGIALGEVVIADATVTGAGVVLAQRLEQLAPPGGICISGAVREAVPDRLPVDYTALGARTVKGFEERVLAFSVMVRPGATLPAPVPPANLRPTPRLAKSGLALSLLVAAAGIAWSIWLSHEDASPGRSAPSSAAADVQSKPRDVRPPAPTVANAVPKRSIAVLPFANMSDDPAQEYFSDGLTEDIITDLARISGLLVIARNSAFVYKGRAMDVKTVGSELGVRYVVEGSVRRAGDRVRITAQLIDAQSGMHMWAERYDRELGDVFALQDEVTRTIVDALSVNLTPEENAVLSAPADVGLDAYDLLLRGNEIMARFSPESMVEARRIFEQVVRLNPRYARAHANIAFTYAQEALFNWTEDIGGAIRLGLEAAEAARRLDDRLPQLHLTLSNLHGAGLEWEEAARAARQTIKLEPSYADGHVILAVAETFLGDLDAATTAIAKAKRLNPHYSFIYLWVEARILYLNERYAEALALLEEAVERNPEFDQVHIMLAATYAQLGRLDDAEWEAEQILVLRPGFTIEADIRVRGFREPRLLARYEEGLRKAGLP